MEAERRGRIKEDVWSEQLGDGGASGDREAYGVMRGVKGIHQFVMSMRLDVNRHT